MTDRYHDQTSFIYQEPILAVVRTVNPITDQNRTLSANVYALDGRGAFTAFVSTNIASSRHVRKGYIVKIEFLSGFAAYAVITGILFNNEQNAGYKTALPAPHVFLSDQVYHHEETNAFFRFRSASATALDPGPDGDACLFDFELASGLKLAIHEAPNGGMTPNRASVSLTMPSGAVVSLTEPAEGQAALSVTLPSGFSLAVDASGNLAISSPGTAMISSQGPMQIESGAAVVVNAPGIALNSNAVALGGALGSGRKLAFNDEVESFREEFNAHVHGGVQGGISTTQTPTTPANPLFGTTNALGS